MTRGSPGEAAPTTVHERQPHPSKMEETMAALANDGEEGIEEPAAAERQA